ncbi:MAG: LysM peptidoglycan-binding domain-containing protein [Anaerolineales bacterium]|nr:LysM peptidoglycan-binding domain-containing protein [Anaerolineales bacterium]
MSLGDLGGLLLAFAPVVAGLAWLAYLIFRKDLASQTIGRILSYFVGVIIIFFAVGWLIDTFLISWVNERLQTSQQSTELQQLNDTIEDIIQESTDGDGQINEAAPQPAPTVIYVPVPDNGGDGNNGSGGPVQVPPVSSGPTTYVVQSGDTLSGIAGKFGTTVNDLMLVNGLTNYLIYEGQQLSIPAR